MIKELREMKKADPDGYAMIRTSYLAVIHDYGSAGIESLRKYLAHDAMAPWEFKLATEIIASLGGDLFWVRAVAAYATA